MLGGSFFNCDLLACGSLKKCPGREILKRVHFLGHPTDQYLKIRLLTNANLYLMITDQRLLHKYFPTACL